VKLRDRSQERVYLTILNRLGLWNENKSYYSETSTRNRFNRLFIQDNKTRERKREI